MWKQYKHKIVRDLAWTLSSPNLLKGDDVLAEGILLEEYNDLKSWLAGLDKDPYSLVEFLSSKNTLRLGHYFEQLVFFWLHHSRRYVSIAENIPIRNKRGQTLGEIDVIVKDTLKNNYEQWELSVKFYLCINNDDVIQFIGPNGVDLLDNKLKKLREKQLIITQKLPGRTVLEQLKIPRLEAKIYIKGIFYYHPKQVYPKSNITTPNHLKGWWIYKAEAEGFLSETALYTILPKTEWLGGPSKSLDLMNKRALLKNLDEKYSNRSRSIYIATFNSSRNILSTGFITPNDWPSF